MIGIVFPGQGSQRVGMAKDFYTEFSIAKQTFEEASETLAVDMSRLCFEENENIALTEYTQPAILTAELAMYRSLSKEYALKGDYFGGHSLGEYAALVVSGALEFRAALKIVRERGRLMQRVCPPGQGAMLALLHEDLEDLGYKEIISEHNVEIANHNSKSQVVISAYQSEIKKFEKAISKKIPEIDLRPLDVSAPFHSSIMQKIEAEFAAHLKTFSSSFDKKLSSRVLSNYKGDFHNPENLEENLVRQISATVLWLANMRCLLSVAAKVYEIGPNRPLNAFFATLGISVSSIVSLRSAKRIFA